MCKEVIEKKFHKLQVIIEDRYPSVAIALCELLGRRWSFISGVPDRIACPFMGRVKISDRYGVSVFDSTPDRKRYEQLTNFIKEFFKI